MSHQSAIIVYHKNIHRYPPHWIEKFRDSILHQTNQNFSIVELNYGGTGERIFQQSDFTSHPYENFCYAMNALIDYCFSKGFDFVFNTNVDDYYSINRIEKQLPHLINGADVVSSNFCLVDNDKICHLHRFHDRDIQEELSRDHNIICHPVVGISKNFWYRNRYVPEEIPLEDMRLWQRAIAAGFKFVVLPDFLCFHRLHENSVGHKLKETA